MVRWWNRLAKWLQSKGRLKRVSIVQDQNITQIYRFFVFYGWKWLGGIALHHIVHDDAEVYHTHEWPYISLILSGGYREYTEQGVRKVTPGCITIATHKRKHYIKLLENDSWSLIFVGPKSHIYGYFIEGHHIRSDVFIYGEQRYDGDPLSEAEKKFIGKGILNGDVPTRLPD